jgi:hypothetical protein
MTKETTDTADLLRRFAEVIPSIPAKAAQANEDAAEQAPDDMAVDDDDAPGEAGMEIGGKG